MKLNDITHINHDLIFDLQSVHNALCCSIQYKSFWTNSAAFPLRLWHVIIFKGTLFLSHGYQSSTGERQETWGSLSNFCSLRKWKVENLRERNNEWDCISTLFVSVTSYRILYQHIYLIIYIMWIDYACNKWQANIIELHLHACRLDDKPSWWV